MVINDPGSVNNDPNIMSECKQYVRDHYEEIPDILKGGLRYRREDLGDDVDLKYVEQVDNSKVMSEDKAKMMRERYEAELRIKQADKEIEKLRKKQAESDEAIPELAWKVAKNAGYAAWDAAALATAAGVGVMTTGVAVTGQGNVATEAATAFLSGMNIATSAHTFAEGKVDALETAIEDRFKQRQEREKEERKEQKKAEDKAHKELQRQKWEGVTRLQKVFNEYQYIKNKAGLELNLEQEVDNKLNDLNILISKSRQQEVDERMLRDLLNQVEEYERAVTSFIRENKLRF